MSRITFYASVSDIMKVCESVNKKIDIKIIPSFSVKESDLPQKIVQYNEFSIIPEFGRAANGYPPLCQSYVLIDKKFDIQPKFRSVGGAISQNIAYINATVNAFAAEIRPGGEFGGNAIILGEIINPLKSKESEKIIRAFRSEFSSKFIAKAGREWIGPEALSKLKSGYRLTPFYDHPNPSIVDVRIDQIEPDSFRY